MTRFQRNTLALAIGIAIGVFSVAAFAQQGNVNGANININTSTEGGASWSGSTANASSQSGSVATSGGSSNVTIEGDQAQPRNPVSTALAPTVFTGSDQCLVPVGMGGQAVGFGVSLGYAVRDEICEVLKLSRTLEYLTDKATALKFLRMHDKRVDEALTAIGK